MLWTLLDPKGCLQNRNSLTERNWSLKDFIYSNVFLTVSVVNKLEGFLQRKGTNKEQVLSLTGDYMHGVMETGVFNVRILLKSNSQKVCHGSI